MEKLLDLRIADEVKLHERRGHGTGKQHPESRLHHSAVGASGSRRELLAHGDLFVSVHVNSVDKRSKNRNTVKGASVYTLGLHRSNANFEVAKRENSVIELDWLRCLFWLSSKIM